MKKTETQKQLHEAHQRGVLEGLQHSKSSPETLRLIQEQREYFSEILQAHEKKEMENYREIHDLIAEHIKETAELNRAFGDLMLGSRLIANIFIVIVKFVAGAGVIVGGIYAIKEWVKK